jgi:hypothetical protein
LPGAAPFSFFGAMLLVCDAGRLVSAV